jgi:hypothetical protein
MKKYKKYFFDAIKRNYPGESVIIISSTENNYSHISIDTAFARTSKNPIDRRLDFCAYFLALIQTLDERKENFETIRRICLEIVLEYVRPKNIFQAWLKRLPAKLVNTWLSSFLFKKFDDRVRTNDSPDGFIARIITDKSETYGLGYGFDILECGICKLFKKHNYSKYASILCEVDEVTSSLAGLKLIRSGTIALGAKKCDFRFKKV